MESFFKESDWQTDKKPAVAEEKSQKLEKPAEAAEQAAAEEPVPTGDEEAQPRFPAALEAIFKEDPEPGSVLEAEAPLLIEPPAPGTTHPGLSVAGRAAAPAPPAPAPGGGPPPLPVAGSTQAGSPPAVAPLPVPPVSSPVAGGVAPGGPPDERVIEEYLPQPVPPAKDIGGLGKSVIWTLATLIFGGGLVAAFLLIHVVEAQVTEMAGVLDVSQYAEGMKAMSGSSLGAADEGDLEFISEQLGIDREELGLAPEGGGATSGANAFAVPDYDLDQPIRLDWPDVTLTGVIAGSESKPASVILDGALIYVGGAVQGVSVLEVKDNGAVLQFQGETQWLFSGQRTVR